MLLRSNLDWNWLAAFRIEIPELRVWPEHSYLIPVYSHNIVSKFLRLALETGVVDTSFQVRPSLIVIAVWVDSSKL